MHALHVLKPELEESIEFQLEIVHRNDSLKIMKDAQ